MLKDRTLIMYMINARQPNLLWMCSTGGRLMDQSVKTNHFALISFISGLIALISIGLIFFLYQAVEPAGSLIAITDGVLIPVRNLSVLVALVLGILALLDIKKKAGAEQGKILAWVGILLGAGWLLFGLIVGALFLLSKILS